MKMRLFVILVVILCISGPAVGQRVVNPAGLSTVPQSSIQSGLIRSPDPIDTSGNLVITGNVRGGRYFRGVVPYRSPTDFGSALGSSGLDSFLRDSAGSESFGRYTRRPQAFYSPSGTVARISGGQFGVFEPVRSQSSVGYVTGGFRLARLSYERSLLADSLLYQDGGEPLRRFRLSPVSPLETPSRVLPEIVDLARDRDLLEVIPERERKKAYERLWAKETRWSDVRSQSVGQESLERIEAVTQRVEGLERVPLHKVHLEELAGEREELLSDGESEVLDSVRFGENSLRSEVSLQTPSEEGSKDLVSDPKVGDLEGDVGTEKGEDILSRGTEEREAEFGLNEVARRVDRTEGSAPLESGLLHKTNVESVLEKGIGESSLLEESGASYVDGTASEQVSRRAQDLGTFGSGSSSSGEASYRERAESIMRPYGGFQNYVAAKFKEYMRAGDVYLQEGKYYRAADSYTLASVYKSGSAVAEAGKSHALLAAGEYMSSSLFLMRAFDKFSESEVSVGEGAQEGSGSSVVLLFSSSFSLIDRDTLEKRVSDIEAWHERTGSSELQFLLGYVYYQMGRNERARGAIEAAYGDMGDVEAVRALKKAIESEPAK